ncbi:hypothetical protein [Pandoraea sp. SD6-2]|uniref:hypothetical protein n=1 Tax=Pandoraea sp. SD6-2 TaxID=1286093 RepID=UPI00032F4F93|nr:hypothetical protein [Pandoraea sp. SD6-2]EON10597.1 hypothetical protein C266_25981 [Pandoraea sp. SD6-2]
MNLRYLFLVGFAIWSISAAAEPVYEVVKDNAITCLSRKALHDAHMNPEAPLPAECHLRPKGFKFEATNRTDGYTWPDQPEKSDALIYGRELAGPNESGAPRYLRIWKEDVAAVRDAQGNYVQPNCSYPETYVTNSLRAAPDGKLYLKQGKVTIKCVNGEMRQIYQPLN